MVNFMRLRHGSCPLLNPSTKRLAGFQSGAVVKNLPASVGDKRNGFDPCIGKIPWRRKWQPTPGISSLENPLNKGACQATVQGSQRVGHDWVSKSKHITPRDWHMPGVFFIFVEWRSEWQPKSCFITRTQLRTIVVCQWIGLLFKAVNFPKPESVQVERGWLL